MSYLDDIAPHLEAAKPLAKAVLLALWTHANPTHPEPEVWPSRARLAALLGATDRAVRRSVSELAEAGAITRLDGARVRLVRVPPMTDGAGADRRVRTDESATGPTSPDPDRRVRTDESGGGPTSPHDRTDGSANRTDGSGDRTDGAPKQPRTPKNNQGNNQAATPPAGWMSASSELGPSAIQAATERGVRLGERLAATRAGRARHTVWAGLVADLNLEHAAHLPKLRAGSAPPEGFDDLVEELGLPAIRATVAAYAAHCRENPDQRRWWDRGMFCAVSGAPGRSSRWEQVERIARESKAGGGKAALPESLRRALEGRA